MAFNVKTAQDYADDLFRSTTGVSQEKFDRMSDFNKAKSYRDQQRSKAGAADQRVAAAQAALQQARASGDRTAIANATQELQAAQKQQKAQKNLSAQASGFVQKAGKGKRAKEAARIAAQPTWTEVGMNYGNQAQQRQAAHLYNEAGLAERNQIRDGQTALARSVMDQAMGRGGPSVAEQQLQQGLDAGMRGVQSNVASMRGVNPMMAAKMAADQSAGLTAQTNQQAGILRAQEQLAARGQAAGMMQGIRGQDFNDYRTQLGANMDQRRMNDAMTQGMYGWGATHDLNNQRMQLELARMQQQQQRFYDLTAQSQAQGNQNAANAINNQANAAMYAGMQGAVEMLPYIAGGAKQPQAANQTASSGGLSPGQLSIGMSEDDFRYP